MQLSSDHQELAKFFSNRPLPTGPQHVNEYSVFLNLAGAVDAQLKQLQSDVDASRKSAVVMLQEVKNWLLTQEAAG